MFAGRSGGSPDLASQPVAVTAVAHIREEGSNKWWRFDDETVTAMPNGPMDSVGDLGVAAEKKPPPEPHAAGTGKVAFLTTVTGCFLCHVLQMGRVEYIAIGRTRVACLWDLISSSNKVLVSVSKPVHHEGDYTPSLVRWGQ